MPPTVDLTEDDTPWSVLADLFSEIESPGVFACGFEDASAVHPGLEVEGLGILSLPLLAEQAKCLQQLCCPAPYGRGEQTIWDPAVRRTWQLDAAKLCFHNPGWNKHVQHLTDRVKADLGVPDAQHVEAQLYKMLLYQEGDHFAPHRDTEKAPGMFATMTLLLPSQHEGGQLVVEHRNQKKSFDFGQAKGYSLCCAAFYADCKHELKPVVSGYRLALVYSLCSFSSGPAPALQDNAELFARIREAMQQWADSKDRPFKGIWMLEHRYSEDGLQGLTSLKNKDRAVASVLQSLAAEQCLEVYLAFVRQDEMGTADGYAGCWSMDEVCNTELHASKWMELDGSKHGIQGLHIDPKEFLQGQDYFENADPDHEECEEATGNEGATMNRWYQRTALIVWPYPLHWQMDCHQGLPHALAKLQSCVQSATQQSTTTSKTADQGPDTALKDVHGLVHMMQRWFTPGSLMPEESADANGQPGFLQLVQKLGMSEVAQKLAAEMHELPASAQRCEDVLCLADYLGWPAVSGTLTDMAKSLCESLDDLACLCRVSALMQFRLGLEGIAHVQGTQSPLKSLLDGELRQMFKTLAKGIADCAELGSNAPADKDAVAKHIVKLAATVFANCLQTSPEDTELSQAHGNLVAAYLKTPNIFLVRQVLVPVCLQLAKACSNPNGTAPAINCSCLAHDMPAQKHFGHAAVPTPRLTACNSPDVLQLGRACIAHLEQLSQPQLGDWKDPGQLDCRCTECRTLQAFLKSPDKQIEHIRASKTQCEHVKKCCREATKDMTHQITDTGVPVKKRQVMGARKSSIPKSPGVLKQDTVHVLLCTKTRGAHERATKEFKLCKAKLAQLKTVLQQQG